MLEQQSNRATEQQGRVQRVRLRLNKTGMLRYISHRDMMRLVERAAYRAGLSLVLTGGFNPHPKMSFGRALALGQESSNIEVDMFLTEHLKSDLILRSLNKSLPAEAQVLEVNEIGLEAPPPQ